MTTELSRPDQQLARAIATRQAAFQMVATKYLTAERLVKLAQVVVAKVPDLAGCSTISVLDSLMLCSKLGLEPHVPGGVWLIPFKRVCTPVIDYRGLIDVARRSGTLQAVHADIRYEKDDWTYAIDTASPVMVNLKHVPAEGDRGKPLGAYFVAKLQGGECQAVYLDEAQIHSYRDQSRAKDSGPWRTHPLAMWLKTACRRGVNLLPRTPELQVLREAIGDEDRLNNVDSGAVIDMPKTNADRAAELLAAIGAGDKTVSDQIASRIQDLPPAKQVQLLTAYQHDPQGLLDATGPPVTPPEPAQAAVPVPPPPVQDDKPKRKPGRPRKVKPEQAAPASPKPDLPPDATF